jgi:hypothetical protein
MTNRMRWALVAAFVLVFAAGPSWARGGGGHGHVGGGWHGHGPGFAIGIGPVWWGPRYYAPWYPPYAPYPPYSPYYVSPPVVIERRPPVYVGRPRSSTAAGYWYWCESERAYYPNVETCPEPWVKVAPRPE